VARATCRIRRSFLFEPRLRFGLADDGEDFDCDFLNIIKYPNVAHAQPVLRPAHTPQTLNTAFADLRRFVTQMALKSISYLTSDVRGQFSQRFHGSRSQDYLIAHSGQRIARFGNRGNSRADWPDWPREITA